MANIFITGANRDLGLGFVRHYLNRGDRVWASWHRDDAPLLGLENPACTPIQWDVSHGLSDLEKIKLPDEINLLINNAGIYGSKNGGQDLENISCDEMLDVFRIDAVAPLQVVQTLLSLLRKGRACIANMSSKMGSIVDNRSGGVYAYRAVKSALCIISKFLALDLANDGIRVICLHPGWVRTDMTNQSGLIDIATSVAGLTKVIKNIDNYPPAAFVAYDGAIVPY